MPLTAGDTVPVGTYVCMSCGEALRLAAEGLLERCAECGNGHYRAMEEEQTAERASRRFAR